MTAIPPSVPAVTRTPARCTRPTAASTLGRCQIETLEEGQLSRGRNRIRRCADGGADCDAALGEGLQQAVSHIHARRCQAGAVFDPVDSGLDRLLDGRQSVRVDGHR